MSDEPEAPLPPDALEQWAGGVEDELRRLAAEIERLTALTTKHGSYLKLATKRANAMPGKDRSLTLTPEEEALIQSPLSAVFAKALEGMRRLPLMGGERHRPWAVRDHRRRQEGLTSTMPSDVDHAKHARIRGASMRRSR